jgi:hypothetical protein
LERALRKEGPKGPLRELCPQKKKSLRGKEPLREKAEKKKRKRAIEGKGS